VKAGNGDGQMTGNLDLNVNGISKQYIVDVLNFNS
jgi:hypothetical protein